MLKHILAGVLVAGLLAVPLSIDAQVNGAPTWVNNLITYLDGGAINDVEFWDMIQQLISTRLYSSYERLTDVNIIIQDTIIPQGLDERLEVEIDRVRVAGIDSSKGLVDLSIEYSIINLTPDIVEVYQLKFTMYADGALVAAGTIDDDKTISPYNSRADIIIVSVDRGDESAADMVGWFNGLKTILFEGSVQVGTDTWNNFRSAL